jgi:anti-anti-sigma factor
MTATIDTAAPAFMPRYGNPTFDCGGAQIRAQCRHLATVVTISGAIDAMNIDRVSEYSRRFILAENPFVLDLSGVTSFTGHGIPYLYRLDEDCRTVGVEWALVASHAVVQLLRIGNDEAMFPAAGSVREALHHFADVIFTRRRLLLAQLTKTA